jgi:ABC-type sugar transport system substrate-binding protein
MVQNVKKIGYESVKNMVALADGKKLDKKEFEVGAFMVTKDTMANYHTVTGK